MLPAYGGGGSVGRFLGARVAISELGESQSLDLQPAMKRWAYISSALLIALTITGSDIEYDGEAVGVSLSLAKDYSLRDALAVVIGLVLLRLAMTWSDLPLALKRKTFAIFDQCLAMICAGLAIYIHLMAKPGLTTAMAIGFSIAILLWLSALIWLHDIFRLLAGLIREQMLNRWISDEAELVRRLLMLRYQLFYHPNDTKMWKYMTFGPNGKIYEGCNANEHSWRIRAGRLEFLDDRGALFSEFRFHNASLSWRHTNALKTRSVRNQYMVIA